jgi:hypothetical protein
MLTLKARMLSSEALESMAPIYITLLRMVFAVGVPASAG